MDRYPAYLVDRSAGFCGGSGDDDDDIYNTIYEGLFIYHISSYLYKC